MCADEIRPVGLTGVQPGVSVPVSSFLRDGVRHPITVDEPRIAVDERFRYSVWLSCAEVYNDKLYDLLGAPGSLLDENMRRPLVLKSEGDGGKYIYGLKELKLPSLGDALELVRRAKENRRVFGTGVNRQSSRSHCVFTIKVIRELETNSDERKYYISRLSIVDLAGSERIANTGLTGERLKEAGSINKSLMCLGQCLETMRKNQRRHDKRRQSIVPFRHSKLTELFQSYFQGDGRVVMIVNVDPYGTGYEENVGVMRFSALAKNVGVNTSAVQGPSHTERVSDSESETPVDESDDGESEDEFVAALVDENERLRRRCERAEHLCTIIEATVRDEMMRHMEESIQQVKALYEAQLRDEIADNEEFTDRKIDLFARMSGTNDTRDTRDTREHSVDSIPRPPEPGNASGADASAAADASVDNSHATVIITDTPPRSQVKCVCADRLAHRAVADITDQFAELSTGPRRSARLS